MLGFAESWLAFLGSTLISAFLGLVIFSAAGRASPRYLVAFALGIFFWYFIDTIGGSANLDVNAGLTGGVVQVAVVLLFGVGLIFFFLVDRSVLGPQSATKYSLMIPLLVAVALSVHGFGEGAAYGATAAATQSSSLLDAFGGLTAGIAYSLHKALEPMMIGACYYAYSKGHAKGIGGRLRDIGLLSLVFTTSSVVGAALGYYLSFDVTYFFALGTGTSIYVATRLALPLFDSKPGSRDSLKVPLLIISGFLCIYFAALLHS